MEIKLSEKFEQGFKNGTQTCSNSNKSIYQLLESALNCVQQNSANLNTLMTALTAFNKARGASRYDTFKNSISHFYRDGKCTSANTSPAPSPAASTTTSSPPNSSTPSTPATAPSPSIIFNSASNPNSDTIFPSVRWNINNIRDNVLKQAKSKRDKLKKKASDDD